MNLYMGNTINSIQNIVNANYMLTIIIIFQYLSTMFFVAFLSLHLLSINYVMVTQLIYIALHIYWAHKITIIILKLQIRN